MKIKIITLILAAALLLSALTLAGCTYIPSVEKGTITRITVDAGARLELLVDDQNEVIAATALDYKAGAAIFGEVIEGVTPREAVKLFMKNVCSMGYIRTLEQGAPVTFSVTGNSDYAEVIAELVENEIEKKLNKEDKGREAEQVAPLDDKELRAFILDIGYYTETVLNDFTDRELMSVLLSTRKETISFVSPQLRDIFYFDKQVNSNIYKFNGFYKVVEESGDIEAYEYYKHAFESYKTAGEAALKEQSDIFLSKDSDYNKALAALLAAEREIALRDEWYSTGSTAHTAYKNAVAEFNAAAKAAAEKMDAARAVLDELEDYIKEVEEGFSKEVKILIRKNTVEIITNLVKQQKAHVMKFSMMYGADLATVEAMLEEHGAQLKK